MFGQINVGLGSNASAIYLYVRYGVGEEEANNFHVGIMFDQNLLLRNKMKKRTNKGSGSDEARN